MVFAKFLFVLQQNAEHGTDLTERQDTEAQARHAATQHGDEWCASRGSSNAAERQEAQVAHEPSQEEERADGMHAQEQCSETWVPPERGL